MLSTSSGLDWILFFIDYIIKVSIQHVSCSFLCTARVSRPTIACPTENLIEGKTVVNLSCNADGFVPTRAWMKDGKPLVSGDRFSFYDGNRVLSVSPVDRKDTGEFLCNVSNYISFKTAKCRLDVYCK